MPIQQNDHYSVLKINWNNVNMEPINKNITSANLRQEESGTHPECRCRLYISIHLHVWLNFREDPISFFQR